MCGIVGFVSAEPLLDEERFLRMRDVLKHRGPDDAGLKMWDREGRIPLSGAKACIGLAHRRLSIIDLSPAGHQPMSNDAGDVWISFNGEFYNFAEHRAVLESKRAFRSRTDTEVILRLYEECGIGRTLAQMNGMFAFSLWDSRERKMILVRDRLGKKPLYYLHLPDGSLVYASEIKALLESGLVDRGQIDPVALVQFWTYGYETGERTMFRQIKRLLPGHYAVWSGGAIEMREYWDCPFGLETFESRSMDSLADELEALLSDSIRLRMIADVPVGLFLSGGIDSSLVAALTSKLAGSAVNSFTIGFPQLSFNETRYATAVARHLHLPNRELTVTEAVEPHLESIARQFDEPFGDSSAIPTFFVCKLAREHVTVALTGDGGDELFAGYDAYAKALWLWGEREQKRLFAPRFSFLQKLVDARLKLLRGDQCLTALERMMSARELRNILSARVWQSIGDANAYEDRERWYSRVRGADLLSRLQYMNIKTYLSDDILVKVDRMSMAHALECRCPLLDHRVVEFAARLPYTAKIDEHGRQKFILRHLLQRYIPRELIDRPKMGFCVPWSQWCSGPIGDRLRERWRRQTNGFQRPEAACRIFPESKIGWASKQWNAFVSMLFFDACL